MRDFFWEEGDLVGGDHLVGWEEVCQAKENGGLGIGNLEKRNTAFLMKWLWRFPRERHSLWYKVISSKFGSHPNLWDSKVVERGTFRSPWKAISSLYGEFHQLVSFKIGNGNKVRFWEDSWAGENTLKSLFPSLFRISTFSSRPISDFVDQTSLQSDLQVGTFTSLGTCRTGRSSSCKLCFSYWKGGICVLPWKTREFG